MWTVSTPCYTWNTSSQSWTSTWNLCWTLYRTFVHWEHTSCLHGTPVWASSVDMLLCGCAWVRAVLSAWGWHLWNPLGLPQELLQGQLAGPKSDLIKKYGRPLTRHCQNIECQFQDYLLTKNGNPVESAFSQAEHADGPSPLQCYTVEPQTTPQCLWLYMLWIRVSAKWLNVHTFKIEHKRDQNGSWKCRNYYLSNLRLRSSCKPGVTEITVSDKSLVSVFQEVAYGCQHRLFAMYTYTPTKTICSRTAQPHNQVPQVQSVFSWWS